MKNKILIVLSFALIMCCGCSAKYTLTYENNEFSEKVEVSNIESKYDNINNRYISGSKYLKVDDNKSYTLTEENGKKIGTLSWGNNFSKTPLISECYETLLVQDENKYIRINTKGKYLCSDYDMEIVFKTDKVVYDTNAEKVDDSTYRWTKDFDKGLYIQFSKTDLIKNQKGNGSSMIIRLVFGIILAVAAGGVIFFVKTKMKEEA